jgi:hypothetical protein
MGYETYRPDWDPFFSESWVQNVENPRIDWGDRRADPTSNRRVNLSLPVIIPKDESLK